MSSKSSYSHEKEVILDNGVHVVIVRSTRRKKTVSATWKEGKIRISLPASLNNKQEQKWLETMTKKMLSDSRNSSDNKTFVRTDAYLCQRATILSQQYLDSRVTPDTITWVTNQNTRWGSATPATGKIRLSHMLQKMPLWVIDYVIVHELAHFIEANHSRQFWNIVNKYPKAAEAKAFLSGVSHAKNQIDTKPL